jgi:hypothetical protein
MYALVTVTVEVKPWMQQVHMAWLIWHDGRIAGTCALRRWVVVAKDVVSIFSAFCHFFPYMPYIPLKLFIVVVWGFMREAAAAGQVRPT